VSVALFTLLAQQLRRIILACLACLPVTFCSTFFYTWQECRKNIEHKMNAFNLSSKFVCNMHVSKDKRARYNRQRTEVFMYSSFHFCQVLVKIEYSCQFEGKYWNIICNENPSNYLHFDVFQCLGRIIQISLIERESIEPSGSFINCLLQEESQYITTNIVQ
jgi:hypothetical protein